MTTLHLALLEVRKIVKTSQPATGICDLFTEVLLNKDYDPRVKLSKELRDLRVKLSKELRDLMRKWPEYSGDAVFPVPAPDGSCPEAYYIKAGNLWGFDDYGRARRRLLEWLIVETGKSIVEV